MLTNLMLTNLQGVFQKQTKQSFDSRTALQIAGERCSQFPIWEHRTSSIIYVEFKNHRSIHTQISMQRGSNILFTIKYKFKHDNSIFIYPVSGNVYHSFFSLNLRAQPEVGPTCQVGSDIKLIQTVNLLQSLYSCYNRQSTPQYQQNYGEKDALGIV